MISNYLYTLHTLKQIFRKNRVHYGRKLTNKKIKGGIVMTKKVLILILVLSVSMVAIASASNQIVVVGGSRNQSGIQVWSFYRGIDIYLNSNQVNLIIEGTTSAIRSVLGSLDIPDLLIDGVSFIVSSSGLQRSLEKMAGRGAKISIQFVPSLQVVSVKAQ